MKRKLYLSLNYKSELFTVNLACLPVCFDQVEEHFSYKEVKFKKFSLPLNINKAPGHHVEFLCLMMIYHLLVKQCVLHVTTTNCYYFLDAF